MFRSVKLGTIGAFIAMSGAASASTVFSDSTFNLANYSPAFSYISNAGAGADFSQCLTCGNPGSSLRITIFDNGSTLDNTTDVLAGVINRTFTYDPSTQGAITSISASVDKDFTVTTAQAYNNQFRPIIEQDGLFYSAAISGPVLTSAGSTGYFTLFDSALSASDFVLIDASTGTFGTAHPNFAGDTITFGLAQLQGSAGLPSEAIADYDNLSISVSSVPLPAALPLLGTAIVGLGAIARRRKR